MAKDWYLVAYDVRNAKRLRLVAKVLEGFGYRVQYSIFRCRLTPRGRSELMWQLDKVLEPEDAVMIVPICGRCRQQILERGGKAEWVEAPPPFLII